MRVVDCFPSLLAYFPVFAEAKICHEMGEFFGVDHKLWGKLKEHLKSSEFESQ